MRPNPPTGMMGGAQLGDILNSALETAGQAMPFATPSTGCGMPPLSCGERNCTTQVDLDSLWDTLGVQSVSENPFEPTPLVGAEKSVPTSVAALLGVPTVNANVEVPAAKEENDHCGHCWETKIQDQIRDNSFWQPQEGCDQVASSSALSLKQALSCRHC